MFQSFHASLLQTCTNTDETPATFSLTLSVTTVLYISNLYVQKSMLFNTWCMLRRMREKKKPKRDTLAHCASSNIWSEIYANYVGSVYLLEFPGRVEEYFCSESKSFFQPCSSRYLIPQIKDAREFLEPLFLSDLNAKLNELNTKLEAENKTIGNKTSTMASKENCQLRTTPSHMYEIRQDCRRFVPKVSTLIFLCTNW